MRIWFKFFTRIMIIFINSLSFFSKNMIAIMIRSLLLKTIGIRNKGNIFVDYGFDVLNSRNITFGKNVSLGHYNRIWAFSKVTIGDYVQTALGLTIIAGSHENGTFEPKKNQEVIIGSGCWIGANVTIVGGVKVGKGCIVGAGALVNKDIPEFSIVGGVPARIIKKRVPAKRILHSFGWYSLEEIL